MEFSEIIKGMMRDLIELHRVNDREIFLIKGYSIEEVQYQEELYGFSFPKYYKDFLITIGKTYPYFDSRYNLKGQYDVYNEFKEQSDDSLAFVNQSHVLLYFCDTGRTEYMIANEDDPKVFYTK
jgi:hypothetical protein